MLCSVQRYDTTFSCNVFVVSDINRTFTGEPNSTTSAYLGDVVMFSCIIGGLPRPQIQWIKDDTDIVSAVSNYVFHDGGSILEIRNVQFTDFGRYRFVI